MNCTKGYIALISAVDKRCKEYNYGFYVTDATCSFTILTYNDSREIVVCLDDKYLFDGHYYETAQEVVDAAIDSLNHAITIDDIVSFIDSCEE